MIIILNPSDYKTEETSDQEELNEFRKIAGLENKNVHNIDEEIRKLDLISNVIQRL